MSAAGKKHRTSSVHVFIDGRHFNIPKTKARAVLSIVKPYEEDKEYYTVDEVFAEEFARFGKAGYTLQAARARAGITQKQLASKAKLKQSHISAMENGRRPIGKEVARRLADVLGTDYRVFL